MSFISAGNTTTTTLVVNGDTTGNLVFNTGGANTTALTITNAQNATFANVVTATGGFVVGATAAPAFSAYNTSNQSFTSTVTTKVTLDSENFDTNNNFASSRFTPTVAGYYQFNGEVAVASASTNITESEAIIYKNGASAAFGTYVVGPNSAVGISVAVGLIYMNGTTDYVELYGYGAGTSPYFRSLSATISCKLSGFLARSA